MARVWAGLTTLLLAQRGALFPFVPVCLGIGIVVYFSLLFEPSSIQLGLCAATGAALMLGYGLSRSAFAPLICALSLVAFGVALAGVRTQMVAGPVLDWRYYGPVTGRVVALDRSGSDALRVTLDQVWLANVPAAKTPKRVRLSLHINTETLVPTPGMTIMTTAHLSPPGGAVEPGGFDFRRHAWFLQLGAVGYTRVPLVLWQEANQGQMIFRARMAISRRIQKALPGETGAFATAIITGDRSTIPQNVLKDLRSSNLAHLLAISGLHMGLVSAFVFAVLRLGLLLSPVGLHWPIKKIAAAGALVVAALYLAMSGGNVATERAFVMVSVMLLAVMCNRRAISLRAVALAAVIILLLHPEAVLGPGFQMSFAATTALVAVFAALRDSAVKMPKHRLLRGVASVVLSSAVAGAATAPFAMAHFNQIAQFGLLANLATVPLMGVLVIPAAVLAMGLMPFGLEAVGLTPMGYGLDWILHVAHQVSAWDGSVRPVVTPPPEVLPMITLGAVGVIVWQGRLRWAGLVPIVWAAVLWSQAYRPDILVAEGGALVGVMTPDGRAISRVKGSGFIAKVWLENDGRGGDQISAAQVWETVGDLPVRHIHGKRAAEGFDGCAPQELVIASAVLPDSKSTLPCLVLQPSDLESLGSLAITRTQQGGYLIETARDRSGARLWNDPSVRARQ